MKLQRTIMLLAIVALVAAAPLNVLAGKGGGNRGKLPPVTLELSASEQDDLLFMREEEKLARDVYDEMYDAWDAMIFDNISNSEQQHMDALKNLIDKYDLIDPVTNDSTGAFTNPDLETMYQELVYNGNVFGEDGLFSLKAALLVGALIEEVDILDLEDTINASAHDDIIQTYENLQKGSRNHLRSFVRQLGNMGIVYEARVMESSDFDAIVNSPMERGRTR